jgi:hypothetical protein
MYEKRMARLFLCCAPANLSLMYTAECAAPCPPEEVEAYEFGMCDAAMLMQEQCGAEFDACAADEACAPCIDSTTQGRRLQSMWFDTQSDQVLNELQAVSRWILAQWGGGAVSSCLEG